MSEEIVIRPSSTLLWITILAGPVAFVVDMQSRFALVQWACFHHREWVLSVISVTAFVAALSAAVLAWVTFTRLHHHDALKHVAPLQRARFMAISGFILAAIFALSIVANGVPHLFLRACD
jgi:hypothetical protein